MELRIGSGWDSHEFATGRQLWLGGLQIEHTSGLSGHSDGDVLLHAICDALLGAVGLGDIGTHFASSDPQWRDASSRRFVRHALRLVRQAKWDIVNLDATLILEHPQIAPLREALRESVAELLEVPGERISIKAKTPEGLNCPNTAIAQVVALLSQAG